MQAVPVKHQWTVAEYHRMGETGILGEDARVELIDGEIIDMTPIGSPHAGKVNRMTRLFVERLGRRAVVSTQNPVILDDHSEPLPDLVLLKWRADDYQSSHPLPGDILLIVEVADTTLPFDRKVKARLYAQAGIPEYWIVNLQSQEILVHRDPQPELTLSVEQGNAIGPKARKAKVARPARYRSVQTFGRGHRLAPLAFPDCVLDLDALLD